MLPGVRRQKVEGRRQKASVAFRSCLVCLALCLCAPVALAQDKPYPVYTAEYLDATMKTLGPNMASVRASLADGDFTTAKEQTIRSRGQLATTVTFWRDTEQDEALTLLRTALERMDALDSALSTDAVDGPAVTTIATEIGTACRACHAVYREQDPATGDYRPKSSALQ